MPSYTLRQLEYLVAVAEHGSVSLAASALHVSQSSLSSGISEIERALDLQLLVRHHAKGVSLTSAGERLVHRARTMLEDAADLESVARNLATAPVGAVTVAVFHVIAPYVVPGLLEALAVDYPDIQPHFAEVGMPEVVEGVVTGRFDVGIGYDFGRPTGVQQKRLFDVSAHLVVAASHPLAGRHRIRLRDVAGEPVVLLDLPYSRDYFTSVFASGGVTPDIRYRSTSPELVRSLVARGLGVALLNMRPANTQSVDGHGFAMLDIGDDIPPLHVVAMTLDGAKVTRRTQAVLEAATALARM